MTSEPVVVLDPASGRTGPVEEFVEQFARVWSDPTAHAETFLDFLSPDIHLVDPVSETHGRDEGYGFVRTLLATVTTIRGVVDSWAWNAGDDGNAQLFIAMRFLVDRDGRTDEVRNVDIFEFVDGVAVTRIAHLDPAALLGA